MKMWLHLGQEMPILVESLWLELCRVLTVINILGELGLFGEVMGKTCIPE